MTNDGSCPNLNAMHGHDVHVVALDGDKLKPREDQRKGGNGFGVNEEGADISYVGDGEKRCQEVVVSMAQNTRDEVRIVGGDGQIAGALPAEPGMKQQTYVVSTNSNGENVAPTISQSEYRMGQNQKDTGGGM